MTNNCVVKIARSAVFTLAAVTTLVGCDTSDSAMLAEKSLVYCAEGSPEGFNPQTVTSGTTIDIVAKQLYDRLITIESKDNSLKPSLANSWHVTDDGLMYTFYLRRDVQFHQTDYFTPTRQLSADDVVFSFQRILNQNHPYHFVGGAQYPFFQSVNFSDIVNKIERINDYTVRFHLSKPDSAFLANLATDFAVILSKEYGELLYKQGNTNLIDSRPIGSGPYKFKDYRSGSFVRYYAHQEYWRGSPNLQQLVIDVTPSNTSRLTKLMSSECDVIAYPIAHEKIIENENLNLESKTAFNVGYLGFNTQKPPFDNTLVRKAVAHAINKQAIIETIYFNQAEMAKGILPPNSWASSDDLKGTEYSVVKAKTYLLQAGYEQGFTMDIWAMPVQRAYNPDALTMAKLIQADLAKINITVNIVSYEWTTFLRRLSQGEHQSVLLGWFADHPDPDNFFSPLLSCASAQTGNNRTFWCNQEFDMLLERALQTNDINQRKHYYRQAQQLLSEKLPLLPIAHSKRFQASTDQVRGDILTAIGGLDFFNARKQTTQEAE
ncbi:ABC transporter substrate-binding protein [Thalassotalea agarivorans]|uniref:Cationic peptide transport system substrate-binding protein n=1 Tax=Thalassotalea agarivorans TaxID=349064 RepID=A0A1H9ZQ78_THASX|nr:ABC transporter substrate-binding protein [Thalassotalea agarivorans]SES83931.1 cationic peptide transport system substrate-binding protein [Thalassotalea agarivorans]